jgi:hypothetical protein
MNLTDEKVSQAIAAVMGTCWHEWMDIKVTPFLECTHCKIVITADKKWSRQFSAFTPDGIWAWKEYMEREMPEEWGKYLNWIARGIHYDDYTSGNILNAQLNPHYLVEYLFDHLDGWGYRECNKDCIKYRGTILDCLDCNGTGKVISEMGRSLKRLLKGRENDS